MKALTKFALITTAGLFVGCPIAGALYFLLPSSVSEGRSVEKVSQPRLVIPKVGEAGPELSFNYDILFSKSREANRTVSFEEAKISFNDYPLKQGDILCSPGQDGKFFILSKQSGSRYKIVGYQENYTTSDNCSWRDFPQPIQSQRDTSKTIYLKEFAGMTNFGGGNFLPIDTIFVSSCSFELNQRAKKQFNISWKTCKLVEGNGLRGQPNNIPTKTLEVNYET